MRSVPTGAAGRLGALFLSCLALIAFEGRAIAADQTRVVLGPIALEGDAQDEAMHVDVERVEARVAASAHETLDGRFELDDDRDAIAEQCKEDRACWIEQSRERGVDFLVWPTLESVDGDVDLRFQVFDGVAGTKLASVGDTCELCGAAEMDEFVRITTTRFAASLGQIEPEPSSLVLTGGPYGAYVYVDGQRVGQLPWQGEVEPGPHTVSVSKRGYVSSVREVTVPEAARASASFELVRDPTVKRRRLRWAGWGLVAGGAATTITGAVLLGLDGRDHQGSCQDPDPQGNCPFRYESTGLGAGLTAAGVAMAGVGTGLLVYEARHDGKLKARAYLRPTPSKLRVKFEF